MKLSGEGQAKLIQIGALVAGAALAAWIVKRQIGNLTGAAGDYVDGLLGGASNAIGHVATAITDTATGAYDAVFEPRITAPTEPVGWFHMQVRGSDVLTRNPGAFIDTRNKNDTLGLIDP